MNKHNYSVYAINHIGHGVPPVHKRGHFDSGDFYNCVDNIHTLIQDLHQQSKAPIILFGHSMGSFMAQEYIAKYGDSIAACVLSGTNGPNPIAKVGHILACIIAAFNKKDKPSNFMNNMSFGSYNNAFKPNRTGFDWLSRDEKEVDKYIADPDCGYVCSIGFFKEFTGALAKLQTPAKIQAIPKNLPILLISGEKDPVGNNGDGVEKLYQIYKNNGIQDVTLKLYPNGRHEMLNEINRDEVTKYLIAYFDAHR